MEREHPGVVIILMHFKIATMFTKTHNFYIKDELAGEERKKWKSNALTTILLNSPYPIWT
jgi:hypothetical protein